MNQQNNRNNNNKYTLKKFDNDLEIYYILNVIYNQNILNFKDTNVSLIVELGVSLYRVENSDYKTIIENIITESKNKRIINFDNNFSLKEEVIKIFYNESKSSNTISVPIKIGNINIDDEEFKNSKLVMIRSKGYTRKDIDLDKVYNKLYEQDNEENFILENYIIENYGNLCDLLKGKNDQTLEIILPKNLKSKIWITQIVIITPEKNNNEVSIFKSFPLTATSFKEGFKKMMITKEGFKKPNSFMSRLSEKAKEEEDAQRLFSFYCNSFYDGNEFIENVKYDLKFKKITLNSKQASNINKPSNIDSIINKELEKAIENWKNGNNQIQEINEDLINKKEVNIINEDANNEDSINKVNPAINRNVINEDDVNPTIDRNANNEDANNEDEVNPAINENVINEDDVNPAIDRNANNEDANNENANNEDAINEDAINEDKVNFSINGDEDYERSEDEVNEIKEQRKREMEEILNDNDNNTKKLKTIVVCPEKHQFQPKSIPINFNPINSNQTNFNRINSNQINFNPINFNNINSNYINFNPINFNNINSNIPTTSIPTFQPHQLQPHQLQPHQLQPHQLQPHQLQQFQLQQFQLQQFQLQQFQQLCNIFGTSQNF